MGSARTNLRIAINAQIPPATGAGGIETVLLALTALTRLDDGEEQYVFVGHWQEPERLRPWLGARGRLVAGPAPAAEAVPPRSEMFKRALGPLRPAARRAKQSLNAFAAREARTTPPRPANFYDSLGCDVVHFPFQHYEPCAAPIVFNPHDLQHLHFPSFFAGAEIERRERLYPAACRDARTVVVASDFVKRDVVSRYGIGAGKVQVIEWAPPPAPQQAAGAAADAARAAREKYTPAGEPFALYPAMTWEHKNHLRLLDALALLRDREGLRVRLVCTGHRTEFFPQIERRLDESRLRDQVSFTGMLSYEELCAVYRAAQFVVIPTLFEAASAPLFEAWQHGAPATCAAVTSLPGQAGGAALMFDPTSVESIAGALARMSADAGLREDLRRRGNARLRDFSPERTAKAYRAVYRRDAGLALGEEDRWLLGHDRARAAEGVAAQAQHAQAGARLHT